MYGIPVEKLHDQLKQFCQRWMISEMALFGSVVRADFQPDSDVDILVSFAKGAGWSLFDHVQMQQELQAIIERPVDLVSRRAVEGSANWVRRDEILGSAKVIVTTGEWAHAAG